MEKWKRAEGITSLDVTPPPTLTTLADVLELLSVVIYPKCVERGGCLKISASHFLFSWFSRLYAHKEKFAMQPGNEK